MCFYISAKYEKMEEKGEHGNIAQSPTQIRLDSRMDRSV